MSDGTTRCADHKVKAGTFADSRRGSRHHRGYGTAWDKLRAQVLREDAGLCRPCLRQGLVTAGCRTVDHIVGKAQGGGDERANLQTICKPCHDAKTAAEARLARAGGTAVAVSAQAPGGHQKSGVGGSRTERLAGFSRAGNVEGGVPSSARLTAGGQG